MSNFKKQLNMFSKRNEIRNEVRPIFLNTIQKKYIKNFLRANKNSIRKLIIGIIAITSIEIGIPFFVNMFLKKYAYQLNITSMYYSLSILTVIFCLYLYLNYKTIIEQKSLILSFINKARIDWLNLYFNKSIVSFSNRDKSTILVKLSYHFSLLLLGAQNSLFFLLQWVFLSIGLLIMNAIIDPVLLITSLICIPINLAIIGVTYFLSSYYLANDQTLYSRILRKISEFSMSFSLWKSLGKEGDFIKEIKKIVDMDTYFRVKRELVFAMGDKVLFASITLASAFSYVVFLYLPVFQFEGTLHSFVYILTIALQIKLLYLSVRIGFFYYPLKLGLFLSIPDSEKYKGRNKKNILIKKEITFSSSKVRLSDRLPYKKDLKFKFELGKKYLIFGNTYSGKSLLASVFAGFIPPKNARSWIIRIDGMRMLYLDWFYSYKKVFYINHIFFAETSLKNIFDKEHDEFDVLKKYSVFDFMFKHKKYIGQKIDKTNFSFSHIALLQIAYCILQKPQCIIIDNLFLDIDHDEIRQGIEIMARECRESACIFFSKNKNTIIEYDEIYNI